MKDKNLPIIQSEDNYLEQELIKKESVKGYAPSRINPRARNAFAARSRFVSNGEAPGKRRGGFIKPKRY